MIGRKIFGGIADDHKFAEAALFLAQFVKHQLRRLNELDITLPSDDPAVASEDHGIVRQIELSTKTSIVLTGIELLDVQCVVNDANPVSTMIELRGKRFRDTD